MIVLSIVLIALYIGIKSTPMTLGDRFFFFGKDTLSDKGFKNTAQDLIEKL